MAFLFVLVSVQLSPRNAHAQSSDLGRYQDQLQELSHILGALHHLRGDCVSGERQLWRDNMMELVRLENPPTSRKNDMVEDFNAGYASSRRQYPTCNRQADRAAIERAEEGERLSRAITQNVVR